MKRMKKLYSTLLIILVVMVMVFSLTACFGVHKKPNDNENILLPPIPVITNNFTFYYNDATGGDTEESITLEPEDYKNKTLPVPIRDGFEFDGWYADWLFQTRVSDNQGQIVIGDELYESNARGLYAKWTKDNPAIFPVLMVFVTKVDALLTTIDGVEIKVDYAMTEDERKVCELIPPMLKMYLDAILNGEVQFQVDTIFTTKTIGSRSFTPAVGTGLGNHIRHYNYILDAYSIPELGGMEWPEYVGLPPISEIEGNGILSKYKSIITTFSMNDFEEKLHFVGGSGSRKYANIHMDALFCSLIKQGETVNYLLDYKAEGPARWWLAFMQTYLHEFTHSVELYLENKEINSIDYHDANGYYRFHGLDEGRAGDMEIEFIRLYLLNKVSIDGVSLGIPKSFWYME